MTPELEEMIRQRDEGIAWLRGEVHELQNSLKRSQAANQSLSEQLETIFQSRSWRWLSRYRRLRERYLRWLRRRSRPGTGAAVRERRRSGQAPPASMASLLQSADARPETIRTYDALPLMPSVPLDAAEAVLDASLAEPPRRRQDIICFSIIDWEFRYQRPQQLMSQFAAHGHRVFYLSPSRFRRTDAGPRARVRVAKENLYEVELAADPVGDLYTDIIAPDKARSFLASLADLRSAYDISSATCYVMIASWTEVALEAARRWHWPVVYDCMDAWESFQGVREPMLRAEAILARQADLIVVTADRLRTKWAQTGRPVVLARNAADYEFYSAQCKPNGLLANTPHPIVGYYGAIADWFDVGLMAHVARARPNYHFVLLGGVFGVDVSTLEALGNVSMPGQQPYATMPQYLYHFDACVIPLKVNATTASIDPVKLYEYLSAGKPVVSTLLPELASCGEHIYLAEDRDSFLAALDRAVAEDDAERVARRRSFAAINTWGDRYRLVNAAIASASKPASIVIVTYNNVLLTRLCLESILRHTGYTNYEIVVVDNASTDDTQVYLKYAAARHPEIRTILNRENHGFPAATNQGLAAASGEYLVLLNNDTVVPPGWLTRLIGHLEDPGVGLVGPVTNSAGNDAKLDVGYRTWAEMLQFAADRARRYEGQIADISMLAMYCTALRRDTYEQVGPLDEQFGIGMFEDDDYSKRVRAAGLRVVCAADTFVHHFGQAAFRTLIETETYNKLFERNRALFESKWGEDWQPHKHGRLQWEQRNAPGAPW